jgi:hypothetical protein
MARGSGGRRQGAWQCIRRYAARVARSAAIGTLGLMTACGGQAFVLSDASNPGDASSLGDASRGPETGPTIDATPDASATPDANILLCNPTAQPCAYGGTCCTGTTGPAAASCAGAGGTCGECQTKLHCTSDANCQAATTPHCCVGPTDDSNCSGNAFFMSVCRLACLATETRMCDPNVALSCPLGKTCSANGGDVQKWQLPQGNGYGVCM